MPQGGVPQHVAEHRGDQPQKEQIAPDDGPHQRGRVECRLSDGEYGEDGQQTVKKYFSRDEERGVTVADAFHYERVAHPAEGRGEGQQIAPRREAEHEIPVEHDQHDSRKGGGDAERLTARHPFGTVAEAHDEGGPEGCGADDERDVRGGRAAEGDVLGEEVERTARDAGGGQPRFVAPRRGTETARSDEPDGRIGQSETQEENFGRCQSVDYQYFGCNERRAPHRDGEERGKMVADVSVGSHSVQRYCFYAIIGLPRRFCDPDSGSFRVAGRFSR